MPRLQTPSNSTRWFRLEQHDSKRFWQTSPDGYNWFNFALCWDWFTTFNPTSTAWFVNANNNWGRDMMAVCGYFTVESIT